jgi:predicted XRE-type DNA-binding protein
MSSFIIYKYTSPSKRCYIGYTGWPERRAKQHEAKEWYTEDKCKFALAIRKYGFSTFTYEIIETVDSLTKAFEREDYWIAFYDSVESGYNHVPRGKGTAGSTKYDDRLVEDIQSLLEKEEATMQEIATKLGVSMSYVSSIKNGHIRQCTKIERKPKYRKGQDQPNSKLTDGDVLSIKNKLAQKVKRSVIMKEFGVSKTLVQLIATGKAWSHIKSDYVYQPLNHNGNTHLTPELVRELKKDLREGRMLKKEIAKKYKLSRPGLYLIQTGVNWGHIE